MNQSRIKGLSNALVNIFFIPLIVIAILGSLSLIIPNFLAMNNVAVKITVGLLFLVFFVIISHPIRAFFKKIVVQVLVYLTKYRRLVILILIFLILCWQLAIVYLLSGDHAFDTKTVMYTVLYGVGSSQIYYSTYPNMILLFFIERSLWLITGQPGLEYFVIYLNLVNLVLIDSGILILGSTVRRLFGKSYLSVFYLMSCLLFILSPWVAVPYSDTWAFFLTALSLYLGTSYFQSTKSLAKYVYATLSGIVLIFAYLIKPPLVITFIAVGIVCLFRKLATKNLRLSKVVMISMLLFGTGTIATFTTYQWFLDHQTVLENNTKMAHPMTHFIAMGMHGTGAYYQPDMEMDLKIKSPRKRQEANIKLIKQRFSDFNGISNYGKFLVQKQLNNTADGTFSWGADVLKVSNHANSVTRNRTLIRRLFAKQGVTQANTFEYRFFEQIVWSICLVLALYAFKFDAWRVQLFKYGVVGFMMFLLIFEGGRSRYMIQFLPLLLVLASISGTRLISQLRQVKFADGFGSQARKQDI